MSMGSFCNLPEEITFDILSRLPAKSVGMCRCVSKPWRSLLSQPQFIKAHLQKARNTQQWSLTFDNVDYYPCYASLSNAHHMFDKITLSQIKPIVAGIGISDDPDYWSCDGLLLSFSDSVLNPITREIIQLPEVLDTRFHHTAGNNRWTWQTFGYDPVGDDYKVILVTIYIAKGKIGLDVNAIIPEYDEMLVDAYSLKNGCWKRAQTSAYCDSYLHMECYPEFLHGCLIWLAKRTADQKYAIVAFSLAEENFFEIPPPHSIGDFHFLCVLHGCLCIFHRLAGVDDLWMMKKYGVKESWTKFMINHPKPGIVWRMFSLDEENVIIRYNDIESVMYNLKDGSFKYFEFLGSAGHIDIRNCFIESLISPCGR